MVCCSLKVPFRWHLHLIHFANLICLREFMRSLISQETSFCTLPEWGNCRSHSEARVRDFNSCQFILTEGLFCAMSIDVIDFTELFARCSVLPCFYKAYVLYLCIHQSMSFLGFFLCWYMNSLLSEIR